MKLMQRFIQPFRICNSILSYFSKFALLCSQNVSGWCRLCAQEHTRGLR